ncbi:single-stranded DNA-binding protein [Ligilactobacillus ruminis]|uniref:single-stranded DNA-binding protein n=1 Tax=Ligilactobacillus ruminis TaxID=1623 RepID=UPI0023310C67|nr:single-stranded DNA-binding protein [Ligilactobacillus ruminis]MDB7641234.1 single-stranded DNA-binding protein [Ligilactobacillus ruminis]MDB7646148.1 single-stranded DNA-binding protein [Ligilactobacillus ruminis]
MNSVNLIGRLTKDVDLRYTQLGLAVGHFSVAIDRPKKNGQSNGADFPNCVAYGKTAESLANYVHKGEMVGVTGSIRTGSYTKKDGQKVYTTDVAVTSVQFLNPRPNGGQNNGYQNNGNGYQNNGNGYQNNGYQNNDGYQRQSAPNSTNNGNFSQNNAQNAQYGFDENDLPF